MNKEQIETRIKQLETERDQLKSNVLAYEGAILEAKHWLEEVSKEVPEDKEQVDG